MTSNKNILIIGSGGQLGQELRAASINYKSYSFYFTDRQSLSISDTRKTGHFLIENSINYCINCAAYTAVDKAETERESAFAINSTAAGKLAASCKQRSVKLIHISTDYVFDGNGMRAYQENDEPHPLNVYGASKWEGEKSILENNTESIVIRTSWLYSNYGNNFVNTMIRLLTSKENISVVNDQFGSPTYAADLATLIMKIITLEDGFAPGTYHYCNTGITTWYDFALEIKNIIKSHCLINPITTAQYPTAAKRPRYSVLNTTKVHQTFGINIPDWKASLEKCLMQRSP